MIIVTGGAGFIGSNFILNWFKNTNEEVINIDKLTYAGNLLNLESLSSNTNYQFIQGDIADNQLVESIFKKHCPRAIINFAAESHVDRSIDGPKEFIKTNILGTFNLLECARGFWSNLSDIEKDNFRFIHISTDEVYGDLNINDEPFTEKNQYKPNSPYSASKASSDHLVRSYFHTFGLPVLTTNCSNNYGPYHFPEKLIPLCISNALNSKDLPIYGDGKQIRDWLYVQDHCNAIKLVLTKGKPGEVYNIGGNNEKSNLEVVNLICTLLDEYSPRKDNISYKNQITFVKDRPGHDFRYAINSEKIMNKLGWEPQYNFEEGMKMTIKWFLNNQEWIKSTIK